MPRTSVAPVNGASRERYQNGDLPPSTMAAQLLHRMEEHPGRLKQDESTFRQLLKEVLDTQDEPTSSASTSVDTVTTNYKLIFVIVKVGLDNLSRRSQSGPQDEMFRQAADCLKAIGQTIQRTPSILYKSPGAISNSTNVDPPMFLWLLPKLLYLSSHSRFTKLKEACENCLLSLLSLDTRIAIKGVKPRTLRGFLKIYAQDLLDQTEAFSSTEKVPLGGQTSPSQEVVAKYTSPAHAANSSHLTQSLVLGDRSVAVQLVCSVLKLAAVSEESLSGLRNGSRRSADRHEWMLQALGRLWALAESHGSVDSTCTLPNAQMASILHASYLGLQRAIHPMEPFHLQQFLPLMRVVRQLLSDGNPSYSSELESSLSVNVLLFAALARAAADRDFVYSLLELQTFFDASIMDTRIQKFGGDLSVSDKSIQSEPAEFQKQALRILELCCKERADKNASSQELWTLGHKLQQTFPLKAFNQLFAAFIENARSGKADRPSKRLRTSASRHSVHETLDRSSPLSRLFSILNLPDEQKDLEMIFEQASSFATLEDHEQSDFATHLGRLICAMSAKDVGKEKQNTECPDCDTLGENIPRLLSPGETDIIFRIFVVLAKQSRSCKSKHARIAMMATLTRLLRHATSSEYFDLTATYLGQYCLGSLRSSARELRIEASRTLRLFLDKRVDGPIFSKNCAFALDYLRNLSEHGGLGLQESCILAFGQVARTIKDGDEMNFVLLKLIEYLGNSNALLSGLAYDELQMLSNHSPYTAVKILSPYWRTVAVTVAQSMFNRPQIIQTFSDLLSMSIDEFLILTQTYTVPYFVIRKKNDILQRVADATGQSISELCRDQAPSDQHGRGKDSQRDKANMAAILATILLQSTADVEGMVTNLLHSASPDFRNVDCTDFLRSEPQATAAELLKAAGEFGQDGQVKALHALQSLANITHGRPASSRETRSTDVIGPFFQSHVLGIMALLADNVNDGKGPQPNLEKKRCIRAIGEMISVAKAHISNGLPQICGCLRSGMATPELADESFKAWIRLMTLLPQDEIATLVEPTIAMIADTWSLLSSDRQQEIYDMMSYLFHSHTAMIKELAPTLPSLTDIPLMTKFAADITKMKEAKDVKHRLINFCQRLQSDNATLIEKALNELEAFLSSEQAFIHENANSEQPDAIVEELTRTLLDASVAFSRPNPRIAILCARCLGIVGCLDPTKVEAMREKKEVLIVSNFETSDEVQVFIVSILQEVLVKTFLAATSSRSQSFLAFAIQELLAAGEFEEATRPRSRDAPVDATFTRWFEMPESVRTVLTPFLTSRYFVTQGADHIPCTYPLFKSGMSHAQWLRTFTFDLLKKEAGNRISQHLFQILSKIIRFQDTAIATFLVRFAVLNVIVNGADSDVQNIAVELRNVLASPLPEKASQRENAKLCGQTVFDILDYLSRWMQKRKKAVSMSRSSRSSRSFSSESDPERDAQAISAIEAVLRYIPADIISQRAVECNSFARALFHWEQYIRQERQKATDAKREPELEGHYSRLQEIYAQIDEPDGIEGISSHIKFLDIDQQILEHRKAGRWNAAQTWYELRLAEEPQNLEIQKDLLVALRESGQHDALLNQAASLLKMSESKEMAIPFAAESCWVTGKFNMLKDIVSSAENTSVTFNAGLGQALLSLATRDVDKVSSRVEDLQRATIHSLTITSTSSLQECHTSMLQLHVLTELDAIGRASRQESVDKSGLMRTLNQRLDILGPFHADKQYVLGVRRAAMQLAGRPFTGLDIASAWLTTAQLSRKADQTRQAYSAVLHASQLGDAAATIEHARLLWRESNHRKAIERLEGAIAANAFSSYSYTEKASTMTGTTTNKSGEQNPPKALAQLLLAKWVDRAGQTGSSYIVSRYKSAVASFNRWERGHFHLAKHYNKLLESEKAKPPAKQAQTFITGETAKLVIENYLRALAFGAKYTFQALPRVLTLWLTLSADSEKQLDPIYGNDEHFRQHTMTQRKKMLSAVNSQVTKYIDRLPAWVFYTALSQIVARICHPNHTTQELLTNIVANVVAKFAPQALWTLLAMMKSSNKDRSSRGAACMARTMDLCRRRDGENTQMKNNISQGQRLTDQLLRVCEGDIEGKPNTISIQKDLGFKHNTSGYQLAMPVEASLTASLPTSANIPLHKHKAFNVTDYVRIESFLDEVTVLSSLQRPRKISIRGSDGRVYGLLCKPKDDLRKDQRLMEFDATINRFLKKDAESSKRRLYIKTYAVTPLNEECGLIEWIDNLRTLREILLNSYKQKHVAINYTEIRNTLNEAISGPGKISWFTDRLLGSFPPVFYEWFIDMFPEPGSWFTARLRYTRSCAVMSIVGHVLGLGDRHGENILFEETNGGTFHVDFNCLFDKGLTFEKPEKVPFRLTNNMVDAMGAYGYEGPFRKSAELTMRICRMQEDTLLTILETFVYDPTTDFIGKKKRRDPLVPDTPEGVLESVRSKVRGLLQGESVPLSVEGYVQHLIKESTDPLNLASMYIGWCSFF